MTRRLTVLFASLEALLVAGIGVAIPLAPLTLVWALHFGFAPAWPVFWRAAVDVWLLGHGADVTFTLDEATATAVGLPQVGPVIVTIALLGFALLTLLLGVRAGGRVAETGHRLLGELTAFVVFALASFGITASALHPLARPSLWQGTVLPAAVFGAGLLIGVLLAGPDRRPGAPGSSVRDWIADQRVDVRAGVSAAFRAGLGSVAILLTGAAVAVAALLVLRFAELIRLYEALHTEVLGGIALTLAQLAILPNLVIWAAAWFVGPGFALGAGSQVSPLGTEVGPVPAIPVLGAVPTGDPPFGLAGVLLPVVAGFLAGVAVRPALARALGRIPVLAGLGVALGGGAIGGLVLGVLAAASGGSAGPGRLAEVGPDPVLVGLVAAGELAIAIGIGLAVSVPWPGRRTRPPR